MLQPVPVTKDCHVLSSCCCQIHLSSCLEPCRHMRVHHANCSEGLPFTLVRDGKSLKSTMFSIAHSIDCMNSGMVLQVNALEGSVPLHCGLCTLYLLHNFLCVYPESVTA